MKTIILAAALALTATASSAAYTLSKSDTERLYCAAVIYDMAGMEYSAGVLSYGDYSAANELAGDTLIDIRRRYGMSDRQALSALQQIYRQSGTGAANYVRNGKHIEACIKILLGR